MSGGTPDFCQVNVQVMSLRHREFDAQEAGEKFGYGGEIAFRITDDPGLRRFHDDKTPGWLIGNRFRPTGTLAWSLKLEAGVSMPRWC